jgi:recombination protein RecT
MSQDTQIKTWCQALDLAAPKFQEIAARRHGVTWAEESQFAMQAINANPALAVCTPATIQAAVINIAAIGLTLNPALGYAYLVPENVKRTVNGKDAWVPECMLRVSFKGLLKIATDSGSIAWARAEIVKANDVFTYRGPCEKPSHEMNPFGDRGATVGVYCVAKTSQGDFLTDTMPAQEIEKIKAAAKTRAVWDKWPDEMAKKAIIKRASKQWPKTDHSELLDTAVALVNEYEGGEDLPRERDITPPSQTSPTVTARQVISDERLETAIAKINAGEYSVQALNKRFALTPEQTAKVQAEADVSGGAQ